MRQIRIEGPRFKDGRGRTLILRGINVDGGSKNPAGPAREREVFFDHRRASFTGRPFPLAEADEHFSRLRSWGFTFLRLLVTWEAIEHAGPGRYDEEYLDYLHAIAKKAADHGLFLLIDPHQDVWSRFSGGDGAPGWTLEAVGFDLENLEVTEAAVIGALHDERPRAMEGPRRAPTGASVAQSAAADLGMSERPPRMSWPVNGSRLAAATMFTLFFGGSTFAPGLTVEGEPVQEFLQRRYVAAIAAVARRLRDLPNVVGYETMNEPLPGWIGWRDLEKAGGTLLLGPCPSPLDAMALGSGIPRRVGRWRMGAFGFLRDGSLQIDPRGRHAWKAGHECVWRGVWDVDRFGKPVILKPDHFRVVDGIEVDFGRDHLLPFFRRFIREVRAADPRVAIFLEAEPGSSPPRMEGEEGVVFAPHWYDGATLMRKSFSRFFAANALTRRPVFGRRAIRRSFASQLAVLQNWSRDRLGGVPTVLGEFGIPFDFGGGRSFISGDFTVQERALDRSFTAVEDSLIHAVLYNYTSSNTNRDGDGWNGEDLSLFSGDQRSDPQNPDSGGRALRAAVRPYPVAVAGVPTRISFDMRKRVFVLELDCEEGIDAPSEIFVPALQYPRGYRVEVSDGSWEATEEGRIVIWRHADNRGKHLIRILPREREARPCFRFHGIESP